MDLSTTCPGLHLRTPLVPAASPLADSLSHKHCEDPGAFERAPYVPTLGTFKPA